MGFWGPAVKERNKGGRVVYYGKCDGPGCRKEYEDTDKKTVIRKLNECEKKDKKEKDKKEADAKKAKRQAEQEKLDAIKERQEAAREKADAKRAAEAERKRKEMWAAKKKGVKKFKELEREARGFCAFCNSNPCKGTKPRCTLSRAAEMRSIMDFNPDDPGEFDAQMAWYNRHMK